ncbi:MAG: hypothetical protein SPI49_03390 [Eubacteriales bacterium]|nr:hypothetical protein [Eubacteriales bacterium]
MRKYSELIKLKSFDERFNYLMLDGRIGEDTFGYDRYLNQRFYCSKEWKQVRDYIIARDGGCDLAMKDDEIDGKIIVHHMDPIEIVDILHSSDAILDPERLICTSIDTHNAIHYGNKNYLNNRLLLERTKNDMAPWKR